MGALSSSTLPTCAGSRYFCTLASMITEGCSSKACGSGSCISMCLMRSDTEDDPMWNKIWDMLMHRCPNLEELAIDGVSSFPSDAHCLVQGRWPKLQRLSLGDIIIDWSSHAAADQKRPFIAFLEAHPALRSLGLSRRNIDPLHLSSLDPDALHLTSFVGTLQQLQALPHMHSSLKSVSFRDAMQTREITAPTVASVLQGLPSLTKLKISFMLHSMYDSGNLLRSLIASCPNLRHLELTCGHKPSFQLVNPSHNLHTPNI